MDFDFDDDQLALRAAAGELLDGYASAAKVRSFTESPAPFDPALWQALAEQGWLGVGVAEADGGLGMGLVEVALLAESLGAHAAPAPFVENVLAIAALARAGEQPNAGLLDGSAIACVAWSRNADAFRAVLDGGNWYVTGSSEPVPYAPVANLALVVAATADGPALFSILVDDATRADREAAMDVTRPLGWFRCESAVAARLGGADAVDALLDEGAILAGATLLGGSRHVLELAVEYAKDRVQFGKPIGSFQAVKHRCADMLVDVEGMHSTTYWAAWAASAGDPDKSIAASTAKCWASDASKRVMAGALQVHGGIGFTWEHDLHFFMKRAQLDQLLFGDAVYHRARLTQLLRPRVESGTSVV